jgi:hypothetical protein
MGMPVIIEPTEIEDLTRITLFGAVTFAEFVKALDAYGANGPTRLELYDVRHLEGDRFSTDEIDMLIDYFRRHPDRRPPQSKTAVVFSQTVDLGLSRMVSILADGVANFKIEAFRTMDEAMQWLEVEPAPKPANLP